ncbi:hypothetical protein PHMEG_00026551 [Phytophthora megakarya]|uniref:Cleavage induced protein n=1 Tax=Phytophthora megakarya TaxID=4795 RepID=A0A225VBW5_9STRA|nr:hypothetical protein PHMEG_00026551 [Phytophthora megakarya]
MESLMRLSEHCRTETEQNLCNVAASWDFSKASMLVSDDVIDSAKVDFLTRLAVTSRMALPELVRLVRGQTVSDPRPNKDPYEPPRPPQPDLVERWQRWNENVVTHGVVPEWMQGRPARQHRRPRNHGSLADHLLEVRLHIRKGQDDGRYIVVNSALLGRLPEVFLSPEVVVDKDGGIDVRAIDDYSFPEGGSVNDFTDRKNLPEIHYNPPSDIAKRIWSLREEHPQATILIMLGDARACHAHMFAFVIDGLLVIDLACGFGWCRSPAWYFVPGALINGLYEQGFPGVNLDPPLVGSFWCDDHTCAEVDEGFRCFTANLALRRAMATVLGPSAITWSHSGRALGLLWDTKLGEVTIPLEKFHKARVRVDAVIARGVVHKTDLLQLLGSLHHALTCWPPARSFFQRVQLVATSLRRHGSCRLPGPVVEDLKGLRTILTEHDRFNSIPVAPFANAATPSVHVHMDASNDGLCVLEPSLCQYIRVQFTDGTSHDLATNSINIRELQSAVLAALHWGPIWSRIHTHRPLHVCCWIDNTSAVSWTQRRSSRQPRAQLYNRLLSLAGFQYGLVCTAKHVPEKMNVMADAGSRAWATTHPLFDIWTNLSFGSRSSSLRQSLEALGGMLRSHALADSTTPKYHGHWSQWRQFCKLMAWPEYLDDDRRVVNTKLGLFDIYCWRYGWNSDHRGNKYSTILLKLASIRWYHRRFVGIEIVPSPSFEILMR